MNSLDITPVGAGFEREPATAWRQAFLLGALSLAFACVALDNTKLVLAVPALGRELGSGSAQAAALLKWVVEANLIVYASLLLAGGALSERFGPRRMLLLGTGLFCAGSLAAALAPSTAALLLARAGVGVGTACMTPASLAAIKHTFARAQRARAVSIWTATFAAAGAVGPLIGGLLLEGWGWRALMLANVPFALVAALGVALLVPRELPRRQAPLDVLGTGLGLVGSVCVLLAILGGVGVGVRSVAAIVGLGALLGLVAWQRRAPHPMLDPALFRLPAFRLALGVILLGYLAFAGLSFAVAQYLQVVRLHPPSTASLLNLPLPVALLSGTLLAPWLMARAGAERALMASMLVALAGAALVGLAGTLSSDAAVCVALVPFAAGAGSAFANATVMILGSAPAERAGSAAATSEAAFEVGGVLGIGLIGAPFLAAANDAAAHAMSTSAAGAAVALALAVLLAWRLVRAFRPVAATEPAARVCR